MRFPALLLFEFLKLLYQVNHYGIADVAQMEVNATINMAAIFDCFLRASHY